MFALAYVRKRQRRVCGNATHEHPVTLTWTLGRRDTTGLFKGFTFRPVVFRSARMTFSTSSAVVARRTQTTLGSPNTVHRVKREAKVGHQTIGGNIAEQMMHDA